MTDIDLGLKAFDALGFEKVIDLKSHEIQTDMLPAFGLSAGARPTRHFERLIHTRSTPPRRGS